MAHEVAITVALFGLYVIFTILRWAYKRKQIHQIFVKYNIPGPKPNFLDGNMTELRSANTPNEVMTRWMNKYGPVLGYFIGEVPYMVVKDLEMLKQVMIKDFQHFTDRPDMFLEVKPLCDTVIAQRGQRWKDVRRVLTPTFSSSKIRLMAKSMNEKVDKTLKLVQERSERDEMFDMYQVVQGLTLDVIAECALAMKTNCQTDPNDHLLDGVQQFFRHAHNRVVEYAIMFPLIARLLEVISKYLTAGKMTTMIVKNVKEQIKRRRNNPDFHRMDLLQIMFDSVDNEADGKKTQLTDDELIANAYVFLLAGYETTGTALALTFYQLIMHPEVQETLYEEILESCVEDDLSYDCVQNLQYMDQVLNESMRLLPPVTGFITRKCIQECTIGKYTIPKDTMILAPIWDIQHDPELWPDPWSFDPDRFSKENKPNLQNLSYFPFGIGPRNCIGMRFAQLEAKLAIAKLLRKFKFVKCEKTEDQLTLICPTVIINPSKGIFLKAIPREEQTL